MNPRAARSAIFVDSSGYVAAALVRDDHHAEAESTLRRLTQERTPFVTTRYVLAETHALILVRRHNPQEALAVVSTIERSALTTLVPVTDADELRARAILTRYADKLVSLTDATSFAVMERWESRLLLRWIETSCNTAFLACLMNPNAAASATHSGL